MNTYYIMRKIDRLKFYCHPEFFIQLRLLNSSRERDLRFQDLLNLSRVAEPASGTASGPFKVLSAEHCRSCASF
ncbi:MAG: hypothetical protein Q4G02_01830, partial [bacterium]|nr:hypothetical protein [bacterium]